MTETTPLARGEERPEAACTGEPYLAPRFFVLKHGDTFLVADAQGDISGEGDGLFSNDTRVLSRYALTLGGRPPALLASSVSRDNVFFVFHGTNRPLPPLGDQSTPEGVIHIERKRFIWEDRVYERIRLANYGERPAIVPLALRFDADFRDMFEVRGIKRRERGTLLAPELGRDRVTLRYRGLDGVVRASTIAVSEPPAHLRADGLDFELALPESGRAEIYLSIGAEDSAPPGRARFRAAAARACLRMRAEQRRGAQTRTPARLFDEWMQKSRADLALLTTSLPTGPFPYAGVPWFSTPFGRDAIVTGLQTLWLDPGLTRGVLAYLARSQAQGTSQFQQAEPGKILHETRKGEMTRLHELPFGQYYGGVDTTPLFVMLAGAYARRTGDMRMIEELWPALEAAMRWIEGEGDANGDGFIDYTAGLGGGLVNQAWKDSTDAIFHADGRMPPPPIATVEVQGYAFASFRAMAELAERRGDLAAARRWNARAEQLRAAVETRFWMEDAQFYALALDGRGAQCRVRASNAGHLLFVGLPRPERAAAIADQLGSASFDSGWGIRTLAREAPRFNPMSYHNGSVWPHDTAICAAGLARYGYRRHALRLLDALFEAAVHFGMRLPELFCGFARAPGMAPISYPVACLPQAWSAGAVFMLVQSCLGLAVDGMRGEIHVDRPALPLGIDRLDVHRLAVGDKTTAISFQRIGDHVAVYPLAGDEVPVFVRA